MKLDSSISKKVFTGSIWTFLSRIGVNILGIISTIVLARLLDPSDFGVVAMAMVFFSMVQLMSAVGLDSYLISKQDVNKNDFNLTWTINLMLYSTLALVFILLSGPVALFYNKPELSGIVMFLSLLLFITGLENIAVVEYRKKIDFSVDFKLQVYPKVVAVVTTIIAAWVLRTYWALVIGMIVNKTVQVILSFVLHKHRPKLQLKGCRDVFMFSKWLFINNILFFLNSRFIEMIIGKVYDAASLGLFTLSKEVGEISSTQIASSINRAAFSGYAHVAGNKLELTLQYRKTLGGLSLICIPAALGLASIADLFVPVVLGDKWLAVTPFLQIIAISSVFGALNGNTGYIYLAVNKPKITTLLTVLRLIILFSTLWGCIQFFSFDYLGYVLLITAVIQFFIAQSLAAYYLNVSLFKEIFVLYLIPTISSLFMVISIFTVKSTVDTSILSLLFLIFLGAIVYVITVILLAKSTKIESDFYKSVFSTVSNRLNGFVKKP